MRNYESFLTLAAELDGDLLEFQRVALRNRQAWERIEQGARDPIDWGALGFTLHALYGVLEGYFLRVSKFFENGLPSQSRHKALVEKMAIDIPGLKPPFFRSEAEKRMAMELLRFRHRIRNLYGEDFDIDLALEGGDLDSALDIAEGSSFEVDLVRLELLPAAMRVAILREGIELG